MNRSYYKGRDKSGNLSWTNTKKDIDDAVPVATNQGQSNQAQPILKYSANFAPKRSHRADLYAPYFLRPRQKKRRGTGSNKLVNRTKKMYCRMYHRYGYCKLGVKCKYIHNPERKRLCRHVLKPEGCSKHKLGKCLLNHESNEFNTPHCSFFLRGFCSKFSKSTCPYLHVKIANDAPICARFAREGYCKDGRNCTKIHVFSCPESAATGTCTNKQCPFDHSKVLVNKNEKPVPKAAEQQFNFSLSAVASSSVEPNESDYSDKEATYSDEQEAYSDYSSTLESDNL